MNEHPHKFWEGIRYFKPQEFDSPDLPGSSSNMNIEFIQMLDKIRHNCGFSFQVNSGYRTREHNYKVAKVEQSAHTLGLAADIGCDDSSRRFKIIKVAIQHEMRRIGIGKTFVHLDMDLSKPQEVVWLY